MTTYEITKWPDGAEWLKLEPQRIDDQISFAKNNGISHFICQWHLTDGVEDFSKLESLEITGLNVTFNGIKSNAAINKFRNLRILKCFFSEPVSLLDFSNLKRLEELEITWNKKIQGLGTLVSLRDLRLWKYKPPLKNLYEFKEFKKLRKLLLAQSTIESLDGIQNLNQLLELEIARPKGFKIFLKGSSKKPMGELKRLVLSFSKELDFNSIPEIENLSELCIADCGDTIQNIDFVKTKFPNLKCLIVTRTDVGDGNLEALLMHPTLEKVIIDHKKHYNLKEKEINAVLSERRKKN